MTMDSVLKDDDIRMEAVAGCELHCEGVVVILVYGILTLKLCLIILTRTEHDLNGGIVGTVGEDLG